MNSAGGLRNSAADREHPPEHDDGDDIGRILRPVQYCPGPLVELLAAGVAEEAARALRRAVRLLGA